MNKNILRFSITLLLALALGTYFYLHSDNKISNKKLREFKIKEVEVVDKIVLSNGKTDSVILDKTKGVWMVNSNYVAKAKQVEELLRIAGLVEAKFRVKSAKQNCIKVDYYSADEQVKTYYLGGSLKDSIGFYAFQEKSSPVFAIHVPGESPDLKNLFSPREEEWRSLTIAQIKSKKIKVIFFDKAQNSFSMELVNEIPKLYDFQGKMIPKINLEKAATYLRQLKNIEAKKIVAVPVKGVALFELTIEGNLPIKAFRKKAEGGQKDFAGNKLEWDNEYFYAQQGNDWYLMDYFTFDGILKTAQDFRNE
jgi:hypothetical protein